MRFMCILALTFVGKGKFVHIAPLVSWSPHYEPNNNSLQY